VSHAFVTQPCSSDPIPEWTPVAVLGIVLRSLWRRLPKFVTNTLYIALSRLTVLLIGEDVSLPVGAVALMVMGVARFE
jgi:hypothetical protein